MSENVKSRPSPPTSAAVNVGRVERGFVIAVRQQSLSYTAGQTVHADAALRASMEKAMAPVKWERSV